MENDGQTNIIETDTQGSINKIDQDLHYFTGEDGKTESASEEISEPLMVNKTPQSLDKILTKIGVGNFHWKLMAICGAGWTADNGWTQTIPLIIPSVQREFGVKDWQAGFLASSLFIGMAVGSHFWGRWADATGRRFAFNTTLLIAGVFGLAASVSVNFPMLIVLYFALGTGVGGNLPVDGAMFAEFTPRLARGRLLVTLSVFWSLGGFLVSLVAWAVIPSHSCGKNGACPWNANMGWRLVVGSFGVLNIVTVMLRVGLPETPAFLLLSGDVEEAQEVLRYMAKQNDVGPQVETLIQNLTEEVREKRELGIEEETSSSASSPSSSCRRYFTSVKKLFEGRHMYQTTLLLWGIWFCTTYAYGGFNQFLTKLLEAKNITTSNVYRDALLYAAAGVPGSLMGSRLVESALGRKWTMVISTGVTACCMMLFYLVNNEAEVIVMSCLINVASMVMFAAYYTYTPEVYKTSVRGTVTAT